MGLFGKKKEENAELPPLQFPELPKSVPNFESGQAMQPTEAQEIKSAVSPQPGVVQSPGFAPIMPPVGMGAEQPLFVKIDKYRDVVETLNKLKVRLKDADQILAKLNRLKEEEDRELIAWRGDLEKIRGQLLNIDKKLFE